ncbi:MAG: Gfo/Idh/MocA family oxidoreductase, partial [Candidatus Omnitrophica bacterium]|nr:Gfo/Idh/MocA family oxidoreductase [Candidatus Omnitrophota bacterium]
MKIGIAGCGAIGGGIARYVLKELKKDCQLTGLYDIEYGKVERLRRELGLGNVARTSLKSLVQNCELMIEAVNARSTRKIIRQALLKRKHVLAMSVGKLLKA